MTRRRDAPPFRAGLPRGGWTGAAAALLALSATGAAAAPRPPLPAVGDPALPAQGPKAPVEPPEDADAAPPPALPRGASFGAAQLSAGGAALNFPGAAMSFSAAPVTAPQSPAALPQQGAPSAPGAAAFGDAPPAGARFGGGSVPGAAASRRDRGGGAEGDPGPPDAPPPPGARFGTGQLSFSDAPMRFADSHVAAASSHFAAPGAAALPGGMAFREEGRGLRVTLDADVLFDFDRAELRPDAGPRLHRLVQEVSARIPRPAFRVEGHTDSIGGDAYNLRLSARRADSVRNWLVGSAGVPRPAVSTAGYGESRPVAPNSTPDGRDDPEGRQRNRRVELLVTPR